MKFKTKQEKRAFRMGCAVGKKQVTRKKPTKKKKKLNINPERRTLPVVCKRTTFHDDFKRTDSGRIKGSYTVDGFFEPD